MAGFCTECGEALAGGRFCGVCGAPVAARAPTTMSGKRPGPSLPPLADTTNAAPEKVTVELDGPASARANGPDGPVGPWWARVVGGAAGGWVISLLLEGGVSFLSIDSYSNVSFGDSDLSLTEVAARFALCLALLVAAIDLAPLMAGRAIAPGAGTRVLLAAAFGAIGGAAHAQADTIEFGGAVALAGLAGVWIVFGLSFAAAVVIGDRGARPQLNRLWWLAPLTGLTAAVIALGVTPVMPDVLNGLTLIICGAVFGAAFALAEQPRAPRAVPERAVTAAGGVIPAPTNGLAVAALVLGLVGVPVVGLVLGLVALSQIKRAPGQSGRGMAIAGVVLSAIYLAVLVGAYVALVALADG